jgi:hypothetical protein
MSFLLSVLLALPSFASDFSVVGPLVREDHLDPGQRTAGTILVRNNSDSAQQLMVYRRDYLFHADGTNEYLEPATTARSNAAWVDFTASELILEPHGTERLHYRVDVPLDPKLAGTYWSLLMIEPSAVEPLETAAGGKTVSIQTVVRYGIQLVSHVGSAEGALLAFDHGELVPSAPPDPAQPLTAKAGRALHGGRMSIDIRNAGTSLLAPRVWVELFDANGEKAGRFEARGRPGLLPGCSARYAIDIGNVTPGAYTALTVADAGMNSVFGTEYQLDLH